jgi:hypothetical protein
MNINNFVLLNTLASEDGEIAMFSDFVGGTSSAKTGNAIIHIGSRHDWFQKLARQQFGGPKYHTMLIICQQDEYEAMKGYVLTDQAIKLKEIEKVIMDAVPVNSGEFPIDKVISELKEKYYFIPKDKK